MSIRRAKQLIYGALYIVVVVVFVGVVYIVVFNPFGASPAPVCTPSTCPPTDGTPVAAQIAATYVTSPGHYTFLAQANNGSADYGAQALNYEIDLYNASDTIIRSVPGQTFIYPLQNKYIVVPNVPIALPFDHAQFNITSVAWLPSSTLGASPGIASGQFAMQNVQPAVASTSVSVGGQITNTSIATYEKVVVVVIFEDLNGTPIGASQTEVDNLAAGRSTDFSVIYPAVGNINPALNQILIYAIR